MRIHSTTLTKIAKEKGASVETLAQAVERTGMKGSRAVSAVKNWMKGTDHPRCKAGDIAKLAQALGVETPKIAKFECILKYHKGSPRKAKLLTDLVKGKNVDTAINLLTFTTKRAAVDVKKALNSAIADAEQVNADVTALVVAESRVDEGPTLKRFHQKDRGRAHSIFKRMTHITIALAEKA
ncbi:MAG: 50S ribosomal protein L22 [Phycisphaerales bacterium]